MKRWFALALVAAVSAAACPAAAFGPSFDCDEAEGTVEEMVCADSLLSALDVEMAAVWKQVMTLAVDNVDLAYIKAEQRGWIKGRNDCWKEEDVRACVERSYRYRIAELQARWRLVSARGPFFFACEGNAANEVVATFFETDPPTAVLERGDQTVVAYITPAASGAKYEGANVIFWTKGDTASVTWGYGTEEFRCVLRRRQE